MNELIQFQHVSKRYRLGLTRTSLPALISRWARNPSSIISKSDNTKESLWAVKDVSFGVRPGESLALIGPNGAGKTTILKLIARITDPTSGSISTRGRMSALIELGAGFHPDLTGRENIYLNGTILGLTKEEITQRFDEIVDFSELEKFLDTPLKRYSSGMAVRLGFSVASCIDPEILLVDEVLAVGDQSFRQKCVERIKSLVSNGTSIIFVSHNLWLVHAICPSALYIDQGQVVFHGDTTHAIELYDRNLNEKRVAEFVHGDPSQGNTRSVIDINSIDVTGDDSLPNGDLRNDRRAVIRVYYSTLKQLGNVNVVVRIMRSDGITCCMMRSKIDETEIKILPGSGMISVELNPLQLYGGTYLVQVLFRDESDAESIAVGWSSSFYVAGSLLSHQSMNGIYEPNREWRHEPLPRTSTQTSLE